MLSCHSNLVSKHRDHLLNRVENIELINFENVIEKTIEKTIERMMSSKLDRVYFLGNTIVSNEE